ncbi:MAG: hypothetical protein ACO31E_13680, partial [Phycisphaerales bacterium]
DEGLGRGHLVHAAHGLAASVSLSDSTARLASAQRDLMAAWHRVSEAWHDDTARGFRERTIDPVEQQLRSAMNALQAMDETLRRVRQECGDR